MSRTLVIQSFRTVNVPGWMQACLDSVRGWAEGAGHDYRFMGDEFFELLPAWVRVRCAGQLYPQVDLARLYALRQALAEGYERVLWLDADILVFDPARMSLPDATVFAREVLMVGSGGAVGIKDVSINNACMVFRRGDGWLEEYIARAEALLRDTEPARFTQAMIGPELLTRMDGQTPLPTVSTVQLFTSVFTRELYGWLVAGGARPALFAQYRECVGAPVVAANLCHHDRALVPARLRDEFDRKMGRIVRALLESGGGVVN